MTRPAQSEAALHAAVAQFLDLALPDDAVWHHSPNESKAHVAWRAKLKRAGTKTGWPDIEILWNRRAYFIELKTTSGRLTEAQKQMNENIRAARCPVGVCRSLDEVEAALLKWNIPLKARAA